MKVEAAEPQENNEAPPPLQLGYLTRHSDSSLWEAECPAVDSSWYGEGSGGECRDDVPRLLPNTGISGSAGLQMEVSEVRGGVQVSLVA